MGEKEIRLCPNLWTECQDCRHDEMCKAGLYHGEESIILEIAATVEKQIDKEVAETVANIKKGTWLLAEEDFWTWWGKSSTPNLHAKEPMPAGQGVPGGGSSNSVKQEKKGTKKTIYEWGCFK